MSRLQKLKEMVRFCELMNQNGLNFFNSTLTQIDALYESMKSEWADPPQFRGAEHEG